MPEVVVATPNADGKPRNWDEVFPIWKQNVSPEWSNINQILEQLAMNNRFGGKTMEELKAALLEEVRGWLISDLDKTLVELQALPNPEAGMFGAKKEDITDEHKLVLEERNKAWAQYGRWCFYLDEVIANFAGAHREYK